jgi:hypothetical protein
MKEEQIMWRFLKWVSLAEGKKSVQKQDLERCAKSRIASRGDGCSE